MRCGPSHPQQQQGPASPAWLLQEMKLRQECADDAVCERIWKKITQPHKNKLYIDPAQRGYDVSVETLLPNVTYGDKVLLVPGQIFETPNSLLKDGLITFILRLPQRKQRHLGENS